MPKPKMPTTKIALEDIPPAIIIHITNIGNQTFAWLHDDDRFMVAIDGNDKHEDACKEWFRRWFIIKDNQQIRIHQGTNDQGRMFIIQIKQTNGL